MLCGRLFSAYVTVFYIQNLYLSRVLQFLRKFKTKIWRKINCPYFAHEKYVQVRLRSFVALSINQIASVPESMPGQVTLKITILGTNGSN